METQLAKKDQVWELNDDEQGMRNEEITEEKKLKFEVQDLLVEVNLGIEEERRMTKISSLLPKEN